MFPARVLLCLVPGVNPPASVLHTHNGGVAQLVRARGSYPRCRWFKSSHRHHYPLHVPRERGLTTLCEKRRGRPRGRSRCRCRDTAGDAPLRRCDAAAEARSPARSAPRRDRVPSSAMRSWMLSVPAAAMNSSSAPPAFLAGRQSQPTPFPSLARPFPSLVRLVLPHKRQQRFLAGGVEAIGHDLVPAAGVKQSLRGIPGSSAAHPLRTPPRCGWAGARSAPRTGS